MILKGMRKKYLYNAKTEIMCKQDHGWTALSSVWSDALKWFFREIVMHL